MYDCKGSCLDELAQVAQAGLLGLRDLLDQDQDAVDDGLLVLKAAVFPQHVAQEVHQRAVLLHTQARRTLRTVMPPADVSAQPSMLIAWSCRGPPAGT